MGGIYVIQVVDKRETRVVPFLEAQKAIRAKLQFERLEANARKIRAELRSKASIWPPKLLEQTDYRLVRK